MTTMLKISTNGPYVTTITDSKTGRVLVINGPGSNVEQSISLPHGTEGQLTYSERPATDEERALYNEIEGARNKLFSMSFAALRKLNGEDQGSI